MKCVVVFIFSLLSIALVAQDISKEELLGKFNPAAHPDFVQIDGQHTTKSSIYLRQAAYDAFVQMAAAAKADGITLTIISATRNFNYQKGIWERKWKRTQYMGWQDIKKAKDILSYSSMPGSSRHHWGTDIDLNALNNDWFKSGEGKKIYDWLQTHAATYGFHQVYTSKENGRRGYNEERWHWSYLPLASEYLRVFNETVTESDFSGFSGAQEAENLRIIQNYVNGIEGSNQK